MYESVYHVYAMYSMITKTVQKTRVRNVRSWDRGWELTDAEKLDGSASVWTCGVARTGQTHIAANDERADEDEADRT